MFVYEKSAAFLFPHKQTLTIEALYTFSEPMAALHSPYNGI